MHVNKCNFHVDEFRMEVVENVPLQLWASVAGMCPYATFFHTPAWAEIVQSTYPHRFRIATRAFEFAQNDWVILPLMETEQELRGFFRKFSNVFGVYGGFIATHPLSESRIAHIEQYLQNIRAKRIDINGNPYAPAGTTMPGWEARPCFTQIFPLDNLSNEAEILKAYTHLMRDHIRKASRAGYVCSLATNLDEIKAYVEIYKEALARYGDTATGRQQPQLFFNAFKNGGANTKFWLAKKDGRVAGGILAFYHRQHSVAWHAAFGTEDLKFGVAKLLHHHVILDARQSGHTVYDFNPSGGHEGTVKFKQMFGAVQRDFIGYHWESNVYNLYRRVRAFAHIN